MLGLIARILAYPPIAKWLIHRAMKTPYFHLEGYMNRYWLFNPYGKYPWFPWSIRVHHILREDYARDLHDHPWDARTFILRGWYIEERLTRPAFHYRVRGETASIKFGEYHTIRTVSRGGVWTLFVTSRYRGTWGFLVNGKKVPHREYRE